VNAVFLYELTKEYGCIVDPVLNSGRQTKMIGTAWQDTASTVFPDKQELDDDFFPGMFRW
jgi:hypothetical protein